MFYRLLGLCSLVLVTVFTAHAEWHPPFDVDTCVGSSQIIVRGRLDATGDIKVVSVLKGDVAGADKIHVRDGEFRFERLQRSLTPPRVPAAAMAEGSVEVVAFLGEKEEDGWRLVLGSADLVALHANLVWTYPGSGLGGLWDDLTISIPKFLDSVGEAILLNQQRQQLLAQPRSTERAEALVALAMSRALSASQNPLFLDPRSPSTTDYHLRQIAQGLRPPSDEEGAVLLRMLQSATDESERGGCLELAGILEWAGAFDAVAKFIDRGHPSLTRRTAMRSLGLIDTFHAVDHLVPFLKIDEPELEAVLAAITPEGPILNIKAVEALATLSRELRTRHRQEGDQAFLNESYAVISELEHYFHPQLVGILYEWAVADDHATWGQAVGIFENVTGLELYRGKIEIGHLWWAKARPLLERPYNLRTVAGRGEWMTAWMSADAITRGILMRLWSFEPVIDEASLMDAAENKDAARHVLASLWQGKRLSAETRKALVEHFLNFRFVEEKGSRPGLPNAWREFRYVAESKFPFPEAAWVNIRSDLSLTEREPKIEADDSFGSQSLHSVASGEFKGGGGGNFPGEPILRGVIELHERDAQNGFKVVWTLRWTPKPLKLKKLPE